MVWQAWLTLFVLGLVLITLAATSIAPDAVFLGGLTILVVSGVLTMPEALAGFSNEGVATVGIMYVVVAGLRDTGAIGWLSSYLLGKPKSLNGAMLRLMVPVAGLSAFMNNTPLVAMMIPAVADWTKRYRLPVSKFMIPLSFATVLGGLCTLIGTSTNLVVNGLVMREYREDPTALEGLAKGLGFFDPAWVGVPLSIAGIAYLLVAARWLLPNRTSVINQLSDPREYLVEMMVEAQSPLVGKTIEQAGLQHLPGLFVIEIDRRGHVLSAVGPDEILEANDRLVFAGVVDSVVDLQKIRGLVPATNQVFKLDAPRSHRRLIEAVVSNTHPLIGKTIREGKFRSTHGAVVIAVARNGERVNRKIGDIELHPGDTLLLEAERSFIEQHRDSRDYFLVSEVGNSAPLRHERAGMAMAILVLMVFSVTMGWIEMMLGAMLASGAMILTRCTSASAARQSIDIGLLAAIAASFGMGRALEKTGAADVLSQGIVSFAGESPWMNLLGIYLVTLVCTEILSNNAAAVVMFPIAMASARQLDVSALPFIMAIMMAASAAFATPIGYQTHLMVYGPGGYRFSDYVKIGVPLDLLLAIIAVVVIPLAFPF
ncbi:MAG: SLC13 family permease [Planctomycetota bacterium]